MLRADKPYHFYVPIVLKSGFLNLLETSGPLQACNGITLPLHIMLAWGGGLVVTNRTRMWQQLDLGNRYAVSIVPVLFLAVWG